MNSKFLLCAIASLIVVSYSVNDTFDIIFEEANRDFGLFISGKISQNKIYEKAKMKMIKMQLNFQNGI